MTPGANDLDRRETTIGTGVVGCDNSDASRVALAWAAEQTVPAGSELLVIKVSSSVKPVVAVPASSKSQHSASPAPSERTVVTR